MCCNEVFKKAVAEKQHDTYHDGACTLWIEMLVQGELRRAWAEQLGPPRCQGVFFVVGVLARLIKNILRT